MANRYSAEKKTIGELLSVTSPFILVPDWQRNFSWETSQLDSFWQDLTAFSGQYPDENISDQEYFLGSIVLVTGSEYLLLDGQQRLATATILLSVIKQFLGQFSQDAATRTAAKWILDKDDATGTSKFKITLNHYDRDFFRREIQETGDADPAAELRSHHLIRSARSFFTEKFKERYEQLADPRVSFDWSLRIRQVLTEHMSVVAVASEDENNAAAVFETLNDRGIGLSTPDLLRNLLLRKAVPTSREEIIDSWETILQIEDETRVDDFLRHYWLSHHGDVKSRKLYREIKDHIETNDVDPLDFSRDLAATALLYREIVNGRDDDPDVGRRLAAIKMLGAKSLLPAVLSAYASDNAEDRGAFLQGLITLFVRHNLIGNLETTKLESTVYGVAKELRGSGEFATAITRLKELSPTDEAFKNQFRTATIARIASARYLLRELEHHKRKTMEVEVEGPDRVHVEHVYPQKPPPERRWADHGAAVSRIGNLTLLAKRLNQTLRNADFSDKKPRYAESDLILTKELAAEDGWDLHRINARQEQLAEAAPTVWTYPEL